MKITRQEKREGEIMPPFYYGLAYRLWGGDVDVYYVIPFNYIMRFVRTCSYWWNRLRSKPHWIDVTIGDKVAERSNKLRCYWGKEVKENEKLKEEIQSEKLRIHGILEVWSVKSELKNEIIEQARKAFKDIFSVLEDNDNDKVEKCKQIIFDFSNLFCVNSFYDKGKDND